MKVKRIIAFALLIVFCASVASAVDFPDLKNHWAKSYMEDLVGRGYLTGYTDGTIRPEGKITAAEALALLSRVYDINDDAAALIYEDYGEYVESLVPSALSWADDEIAVCLAGGVITKDELESLADNNLLSASIDKEFLAVMFTRAMAIDDDADALESFDLTFDDTSSITYTYRRYIFMLAQEDIITGDTNNNFCPKSTVTRAIVATMLSRALQYLESNGGLPTIDQYNGIVKTYGILGDIGASVFYVNGFDGETRKYSSTNTTSVTVNGNEGVLSSTYEGAYATISLDTKTNTVSKLAIESDEDTVWVQGAVGSVKNLTTPKIVTIKDVASGKETDYSLDDKAKTYYQGKEIQFNTLGVGNYITAKLVDGDVTEIQSYLGTFDIAGKITNLTYGTIVTLLVDNANGDVNRFQFDVTNPPVIKRGSEECGLDKLKVGDDVTITVKKCVVSTIATEGQEADISGEITLITKSASGTTIAVKSEDGTQQSYVVSSSVSVWDGDNAINFSDLEIGYIISLAVYDDEVTDIYLEDDSAVNEGELTGTVLSVDTANFTVILLKADGSIVYVYVPNSAMVTSIDGGILKLAKVTVNDKLVVYGAYDGATNFNATVVIVK